MLKIFYEFYLSNKTKRDLIGVQVLKVLESVLQACFHAVMNIFQFGALLKSISCFTINNPGSNLFCPKYFNEISNTNLFWNHYHFKTKNLRFTTLFVKGVISKFVKFWHRILWDFVWNVSNLHIFSFFPNFWHRDFFLFYIWWLLLEDFK